MAGLFITLEGIDGCGKTTQAERLSKWLEVRTGNKTIHTAEPYILREFILSNKNLCAMSDLLLFLADRAEHVDKIILPELHENHNVICERYNESTLAYQNFGHEIIKACNFPEPDIKIFLDLSPEIAFSRVRQRVSSDKFEAEGLNLMRRVAASYRKLKMSRIICDNLNEDEVFNAIIEIIEEKIS